MVPHLSAKVDVMVLYSEMAWSEYDSTEDQLKDAIKDAFKSTDKAMEVSEIALKINLVHLQEVSAGVEQGKQRGTWWRDLRGKSDLPVVLVVRYE